MAQKMADDTIFLCAEDDETMRSALLKDLKELGISGQVFEAEDGVEAFKVLTKQAETDKKIQFIISDMVMPNATGMDFLKKLRADARFKNIPFLMLTSENDRDTVMQSIANGASNYLLKPWNKQTLAEKIVFCWEKHNK